jgi:hypothetical protein
VGKFAEITFSRDEKKPAEAGGFCQNGMSSSMSSKPLLAGAGRAAGWRGAAAGAAARGAAAGRL